MFKKIIAAALIVTSFGATQAFAADKIAVVDRQKAILETVVAKNKLRELRESADFVANLKERDAAVAKVKDLYTKAQKEGPTMSKAEQTDLALKIQEKEADVKHAATKLQSAEQQLAREVLQQLNEKMMAVVSDLIKEESIGLLLETGVLYADADFSITAKVTEKLNTVK